MNQSTFVKLGLLTFSLILLDFVVLGLTRTVVPFRTAQLVTVPITFFVLILLGYLLVISVLAKLGIRPIESDE